MEKTGESYTTARVQLLAKRSLAGKRLSEPELAELTGISTTAVMNPTDTSVSSAFGKSAKGAREPTMPTRARLHSTPGLTLDL